MRSSVVGVAIWLLGALAWAEEAKVPLAPVRVICPPVERMIGEYGQIPALVVLGKLQAGDELIQPKGRRQPLNGSETAEEAQRRKDDSRAWYLVVEEVLFGSPPRERLIPLPTRFNREPDDEQVSRIYRLRARQDDDRVVYDPYYYNSYASRDELIPVQALMGLCLDYLVLRSEGIVVGRPTLGPLIPAMQRRPWATGEYQPVLPEREVKIERVVHGQGLHAGDIVLVQEDKERLLPLADDAQAVYFVSGSRRNASGRVIQFVSRWDVADIDTILQALQRRSAYAIREQANECAEVERVQEICLLGSQREAIQLLSGKAHDAGWRRLILDGEKSLPPILAAIEASLWRDEIGNSDTFAQQEMFIRLLGELEKHRLDGEVVRLIDGILTKAEAGANFPIPPEREVLETPDSSEPAKPDVTKLRKRYRDLGTKQNHSLAWLCQTLPPLEAAQRYHDRLQKLRDLAQYGWKDEAQTLIDEGHWEDRLELEPFRRACRGQRPIARWQAGFVADIRTNTTFIFSPDSKWLAAIDGADDGETIVWSTSDWRRRSALLPTAAWRRAAERERDYLLERDTSFETIDVVGDAHHASLWTLEASARQAKPRFEGDDATLPDLCQRNSAPPYALLARFPLEFEAYRLQVSADGQVIVADDGSYAEAFTAEGKTTARVELSRAPDRFALDEFAGDTFHGELALSPDGRWLAYGQSNPSDLQVFDLRSGQRVPLGFPHDGPIVSVAFSPDAAEVHTKGLEGKLCRWDAKTGQLIERRDLTPGADRRRRVFFDSQQVPDEEGQIWSFHGLRSVYGSPEEYEIRRLPQGEGDPHDASQGQLLGNIELKGRNTKPFGLVPGGEFLFVGAEIFARRDLKPISAPPIQGQITRVAFSPDGRWQGLITREGHREPQEEHPVIPHWRIHDTRTGQTRFAAWSPYDAKLLAISPRGDRVAIVTTRQQVEVWELPQ